MGEVHLTLQFDGGSRGNPGPAGIGVTLADTSGRVVYELGEFLGSCTNNVAEYTALIRGLAAAAAMGATRLTVRADSQLVVRQMMGQYKVKNPGLIPLFREAVGLADRIGKVEFGHVYRESNARADELANMAMDRRTKIEPKGSPQARQDTSAA